jgi:hypothetical protein
MKCQKCSYTSFDYNDNCPKCGAGLADLRTLLQIIAVSPEQRAPALGARAAEPAASARAAGPSGEPQPAQAKERPYEPGGEVLEGLDFDESFDDLVEPTSYTATSPQPEKAKPGDDLIDLDFGDLFEDKSKEQ